MAETLAAKTLVKPAAPELASDYYLSNFELLLEGSRRYLDILPSELARLRAAYLACSKPSRMLLVRLLSRKGEWFRADKLNYPEIGTLEPAIKGLEQAELISTSSLPNMKPGSKASPSQSCAGRFSNCNRVKPRRAKTVLGAWSILRCI